MVLACAAWVTTLIPLKLGGSLLLFGLVPIQIEFWENLSSSHFLLLFPFQNYHLLFTSVSHLFSRVGSMSTLLCFHGNQGVYCFFFSIFRFFSHCSDLSRVCNDWAFSLYQLVHVKVVDLWRVYSAIDAFLDKLSCHMVNSSLLCFGRNIIK